MDWQLQQFPFRYGIEEGIDPKQVPPGTLVRAENVEWVKVGLLQTRKGVDALTKSIVGGGTLSAATRLFTRGDELCMVSSSRCYSYASTGWTDKGRVPEVGLTWKTIVDTVRGARAADSVTLSSGLVYVCWVTGNADPLGTTTTADNAVWYLVYDPTSDALKTPPTLIHSPTNGATQIRAVTNGTVALFTWCSANGNVYAWSSTLGLSGSLRADVKVNLGVLDACVVGSDWYVAYNLNGGGIQVVRTPFTSFVASATAALTGETGTYDAIACAGMVGGSLFIGWHEITVGFKRFRYQIVNLTTLALALGSTVIDSNTSTHISYNKIGAVCTSTTGCLFVWTLLDNASSSSEPIAYTKSQVWGTGALPLTLGQKTYGISLLTKPFAVGSRYYAYTNVPAGTESTQSDSFLIDVTEPPDVADNVHREVGKVDLLTSGVWVSGQISSGGTYAVLPYGSFSPPFAGANFTLRQALRLVTLTTGTAIPSDYYRGVDVGPEAYVNSAVLGAYDKQALYPVGFPHASFFVRDGSSFVGVGGAVSGGTYSYTVSMERKSAVGTLHRAPPGAAKSFLVGAGAANIVTGLVNQCALGLTSVSPQTELIPVYKASTGGTLLRLDMEGTTGSIGLLNADRPGPLTFTDASDLTTPYPLYTEGGELADHQPPAISTMCKYQGRIFGIDGSGNTVRFSKSYDANPGVAPGFHPNLRIQIDDDLTAISSHAERVIIFAKSRLYYFNADPGGPAVNGDGGYPVPVPILADVGCTQPRSVVSTDGGVFFADDTDLYLLTPNLFVEPVGRPVQDLIASYPVFKAAVVCRINGQVRFVCSRSDGTSSIVLVYDALTKQWSHFKYAMSAVDGEGVAIADAVYWQNAFTFVTTAGQVYKENQSLYLDNGSFVYSTIETAWIHGNGPLSYNSIRNVRVDGICKSTHTLTMSLYFNGDTVTPQTPVTWAAGVTGVTAIGPIESANVNVGTRRKCSSIKLKIQTGPGTGTGQGPQWSTLGIEVGAKRGFRKLSSTQRK